MKAPARPLVPPAQPNQKRELPLPTNPRPHHSGRLDSPPLPPVWDELAPLVVTALGDPFLNAPVRDRTLTAYFTVTRKYRFHAAHRNRELVGTKCESLHGHTYNVDVEIRTATKNGNSVSLEFSAIDALFEKHVKQMCHSVLLDASDPLADLLRQFPAQRLYFINGETSAENLAKHFYGIGKSSGLYVECVTLRETPSSEVRFRG